jgi:hypothetical protein
MKAFGARARLAIAVASSLLAAPAIAQSVASTSRGVVVAHDGIVELPGRWRTEGVTTPGAIVVGDARIAVLDPLANAVRTIELADGRSTLERAGETPIDGAFVGRELYVVARDARRLERVRDHASVALPADPAFVREADGILYVYSRLDGIVTEVTTAPFAVGRSVRVGAAGSAFALDGRSGYVVVPRDASIHTFLLASMQPAGTIAVGAVPVDAAALANGTALSARTFAVADPSAKKVWLIEGAQSTSQAVARGFIRGLLGLGLYANRASPFPSGVDRVFVRGAEWLAYDSASGTLYRLSSGTLDRSSNGTQDRATKGTTRVVATGIAPSSFALTADGIALWRGGRLELLR